KNLREKIGRYLNQQMQVKTNREYAAITTEIDGVKKEIETEEDRGIQFLEEEDSADKKIAADEAGLRTAKDEGARERARIQEQIATKQSQLKELRTEREGCVSEIEAPLLERYAWLSQRYPGKAIVPVTGGNCGGCFMFMLQHRMEELRRAEEVTYCDGCQRILYLTAESEAK
ncbi:MAG: C4-type zinc ribbon domain-containing protein, partial [bacterium]